MSAVDTVIVGAGSSGCALAARLSERAGHRVLLLEAGPDQRAAELPDALRQLGRPVTWPHEWGEHVRTPSDRELPYLRGRGVGGSSLINGGVAIRPGPEDFEGWPAGWGWDEMLRCLCRVENDLDFGHRPWHGDSGPIPIVRSPRERWTPLQEAFYEGCVRAGLPECADHNEPGATGVGAIPMNRRGGERMSCTVAYLEAARDRSELAVRGDATVARVRFDGMRAIGVELTDGQSLEAGRVVLCGGVLQSPLLLWRSGIGPADRLRSAGVGVRLDRPAVGDHWSDHVVVDFAVSIRDGLVPPSGQPLQAIARTASDGGPANDLNLTPWARQGADGLELVLSVSLQLPAGEGRIRAPGGPPGEVRSGAEIIWPFGELEGNLQRLSSGWELAVRVTRESAVAANAAALGRVAFASERARVAALRARHAAFYHGVGTCGMGEDGAAVVDAACAVRGTQGLFVVDCSIVPRVPRTNTNLLAIAVAERAAELL